jgi:hypothetical protein
MSDLTDHPRRLLTPDDLAAFEATGAEAVTASMESSVTSLPTAVLARRVLRRGHCVGGADPDDWFPPEPWAYPAARDPQGEGAARARAAYEAKARAACGGCPVIASCLEMALRVEANLPATSCYGVFGATAPWERQEMLEARAAAIEPDMVEAVA